MKWAFAALLRWRTALRSRLAIAALALLQAVTSLPAREPPQPAGLPTAATSLESDLSTSDRLTAVEDQLRALVSDASQAKEPGQESSEPTLELGGMVQADFLAITQDAANIASVGQAEDVFDFRRARLTGRGEAYAVVEYAIGFDFALAGRPSFLDNYIALTDLPVLGNLLVGHFFEPFSLERYTQARSTTFLERSLADTFAPARNLGILARSTWGVNEHGTWAIGWFRSNSDVFGEDFNNAGGSAVTSRLTWLPMVDDEPGGRTFLHLGAAYTYRSEDQDQVQFQSFPEARAGAPQNSVGIPPFVDTGLIAAQRDQRVGSEFLLIRGPLLLQGEYIFTSVDQINGPRLSFHGAYASISYFLTGENRTYNRELGVLDRVYPFENFFRVRTERGVEQGRGAWELAARYSVLDLDSENIRGGTLRDVTLGVHWHLNPFTRVRWEYIAAHLNREPVGPSDAHIGGMRCEIDF